MATSGNLVRHTMPRITRTIIVCIAIPLTACSSIPDATRWRETAWQSASDTSVWAPLLVAAAAVPYDDDLSRHAETEHHVFGSRDAAKRYSDRTQYSMQALAIASTIGCAIDSDHDDAGAHQLAATAMGLLGSGATTSLIKMATYRERPDHGSHSSFPSGHTSSAFVSAGLISTNLQQCDWLGKHRWLADTLLYGSATAVGWARVEAGAHYPSDVLAGAAVGNFFALWATQLWLPEDGQSRLFIVPDENGLSLQWVYRF